MKPYFKTTLEVEDLSNDDIAILQKRLRNYNIALKISKYIFLIMTVLFVFLYLRLPKYNKNLYLIIQDYFLDIVLWLLMTITIVLIIVLIYYTFFIEQALKDNYVVVCTGVLTNVYFMKEKGLCVWIGPVLIVLSGGKLPNRIKKLGTCIQCRFIGTHMNEYYCISVERHENTMYDPEYISQVEKDSYELMQNNLIMMEMLEEIVNYQMLQVKMGKKDGIKGVLLMISCRIMSPFYRVKFDKYKDKITNNGMRQNQLNKMTKYSVERLKQIIKQNEFGEIKEREEIFTKALDQKNNKTEGVVMRVILFGVVISVICLTIVILAEIGVISIISNKASSVLTGVGVTSMTLSLITIVAWRFISGL